ncbi:MAG TPA: RNA methyltransferase [Turneriella sp.]|nr:RNA methyltransferase [Turneriella sp.]HMY11383.1 RNA methyltransferase [Turneriella sp.]HNA79129.1 RNA methyltransferase [Turneriella sp.]HNE18844.1 RNA methyltransferase [Turneriella sp.]HNJ64585.1 RNA methyltransferase [Turneriella sp.]
MVVAGFHAVTDLVEKSGFLSGDRLIVARQANDQRMQRLLAKAERAQVTIIRKNYGELNQVAGTKNHQGIVLERQQALELKSFTKQDFVSAENGIYLALDGVQDPQNLGAIFRTALGLSVSGIFLPQKDSAPAGATALKASAGALTEIPLCFTGSIASLMQFISDKRPEIPLVALDASGELFSDGDTDLAGVQTPILLVVGSEQGLSRLALERATHRRRLLMDSRLESYNVSVATALALYELVRRRSADLPDKRARSRT